jgi:hypothetical protein
MTSCSKQKGSKGTKLLRKKERRKHKSGELFNGSMTSSLLIVPQEKNIYRSG